MMPNNPSLAGMPPEIIQNIYFSLRDVQSVANLALTSKQFRDSFESPQYQGSKKKLEILHTVVERQFGPLPELFQLATSGTREQPRRPCPIPALTMELVKSLTLYGRIVEKWADKYPQMRWRNSSASDHRRQLLPHERVRFRRAMYCWWTYNRAFHSLKLPATSYEMPLSVNRAARSIYIQQFRDHEIVEMCEVYDIVEGMLFDVCPDNAKIQKWYEESFPGQAPLYFGSYDTYRGQPAPRSGKRDYRQGMVAESWGDRFIRARFVDDVMKLDLGSLLHFCYDLHDKQTRKTFTDSLGENFYDNPTSFRHTLQVVADQRDLQVDMEERGLGGGILWDSDAKNSTGAEGGNNEAKKYVGERHPINSPPWADGGSDSIPSDYEEPEDELESEYWPNVSDNDTIEGFEYEDEDFGASDVNHSQYTWIGGDLDPIKGNMLY